MIPSRRNRGPVATCDDCGHHWFGGASVDALRTVGGCVLCNGHVTFAADADARAEEGLEANYGSPAHLAVGTPRV